MKSTETTEESTILVNHISGKFFVWDADSVFLLRTKYRVCGQLVGSTPEKQWQSNLHSLPLILSPAEAHYCEKNKFATIMNSENYFSRRKVGRKDVMEFEKERKAMEKDQIKIFKTGKEEKEKLFFGCGNKNKPSRRAKREKRERSEMSLIDSHVEPLEKAAKVDSTIDEVGPVTSDVFLYNKCEGETLTDAPQNEQNDDTPSRLSNDTNETKLITDWKETVLTEEDFKYYSQSVHVQIHTNRTSLQGLDAYAWKHSTLSETERCCCAVYEDLHKRGFFITSALKFGGDFLVYLGDPLRHHSHYVIVVLKRDEVISSKQLITYGRLASSVKKTVVLATLKCDVVDYLSLTWAQMK